MWCSRFFRCECSCAAMNRAKRARPSRVAPIRTPASARSLVLRVAVRMKRVPTAQKSADNRAHEERRDFICEQPF